MLDLETRTAILRLHQQGHASRKIAADLGVSRNAVRKVIAAGEATVPPLCRAESLTPHVDDVRKLYESCEGNLVRVTEELRAKGIKAAYSTVTGFCRRHGIGQSPKQRSGRYHFDPGEEMQHDTSPHRVKVGGALRRLECASVVLCYSRVRYVQCFERWNRFMVRVFLTEALKYFGGAARRAMIDNSSVVVGRGTGPRATMAPEMVAFSERFGFVFEAHRVGDANRSGRVERPFHHVENNFYAGRTFEDLADLNRQLLEWCERYNSTWNRWLQAKPRELFAAEQPALQPLPLHIPEVYDLHVRRVDTEGYINMHRNRYSMEEKLIGRRVTVHEHRHKLRVFDGHQLVVEHDKRAYGAGKRITLPEHRYRRHRKPEPPIPEEGVLRAAGPELSAFVDALRKHQGGRAVRALRQLHRIYLDYPTEAVVSAVTTALDFGLMDPKRIERIVLRRVAGDFFRLPTRDEEDRDE